MWKEAGRALRVVEDTLGLSYHSNQSSPASSTLKHSPCSSTPSKLIPNLQAETQKGIAQTYASFEDAFESSMAIHVLIMGVVFHTYAGDASDASIRLTHLHILLDSGAAKKAPSGIIQASIS
jgi:hypothetical protein